MVLCVYSYGMTYHGVYFKEKFLKEIISVILNSFFCEMI